jgi:hypothetical protein
MAHRFGKLLSSLALVLLKFGDVFVEHQHRQNDQREKHAPNSTAFRTH